MVKKHSVLLVIGHNSRWVTSHSDCTKERKLKKGGELLQCRNFGNSDLILIKKKQKLQLFARVRALNSVTVIEVFMCWCDSLYILFSLQEFFS